MYFRNKANILKKILLWTAWCIGLTFHSFTIKAADNCECENQPQLNDGDQSSICIALKHIESAQQLLEANQLDSVAIYLKKAETLLISTQCYKNHEVKVLKVWGDFYYRKSDFQNQLDIAYKILDIANEKNNKIDQALSLLKISDIFNRNKQSQKGIEYAQKTHKIILEIDSSQDKSRLWNMLGARYRYFFQDSKQSTYWDSAFNFSKLGLDEAIRRKNTEEEIFSNVQLNSLSQAKGDLNQALAYLNAAQAKCNTPEYNPRLITIFGDKAFLYLKQNRLQEARINSDSSLKYALQVSYLPILINTYSLIYEIEKKSGRYKEALEASEIERKLSDSLFTEEKMATINELEKRYSQAKNEQEIDRLSKQKSILLLSTLAALGFIISIIIFIRQKSLRQKHNELITEQRLQRARINPHFFFNALGSLQNAVLTSDDKKFLSGYIAKFSKIMRDSLESSYHDFVQIDEELNFIERYLQLQQLRFKDVFEFKVEVDPELSPDEIMIPSMLLQPIVENCIEHGFKGIQYLGLIKIYIEEEQNKLKIKITDNGKGMSLEKSNKDHISRANQILTDRIYLLNKKFKTQSSFEIENNIDQGVCVTLFIPLIYKNEIEKA